MARNLDELVSRQQLIFARSPFEKIIHPKLNNPKIETRLVIEAPTKVLTSQQRFEYNFPKSDLSKLRIDAPSERKEFIKIPEEKIKMSRATINKKCAPKVIEIPKENWEKRDFIKLENWHLFLNSNSNDIVIIGYRSDIEELWMSDTVLFRIDEKRLITKSKTCYQLMGTINSSSQELKVISSKFESGFPEDWKEIIMKN